MKKKGTSASQIKKKQFDKLKAKAAIIPERILPRIDFFIG
jgi:hypothetical protein